MPLCSVSGCGRSSRVKGFCFKHYLRWRAHGDPQTVLRVHNAACEAPGCECRAKRRGEDRKRFFCAAHWADDVLQRRRAAADQRTRTCANCGAGFIPKVYNRVTYCSRDCSFEHRKRFTEYRRAARREASARVCEVCGVSFNGPRTQLVCSPRCRETRTKTRARSEYLRKRATLETKVCTECGCTFQPTHGGKTVCSDACSKQRERNSPGYRQARRASKARRKARLRGGECIETFDPIEVLSRDGWRCYICHCDTPQRLRGSYDLAAPELDHVVPLSAGGAHTRANTACICRGCNLLKGDRPLGSVVVAKRVTATPGGTLKV